MDNDIRAEVVEKKDDGVLFYYVIIFKLSDRIATIECAKEEAEEICRRINAPNKVDNPAESRSKQTCENCGAKCDGDNCQTRSGNPNDIDNWQPIKEESRSEKTCDNCHYMTTECVFTAETGEKCIDKSGWEKSRDEKSCNKCANKDKQCINFPCKNKSNWQPIAADKAKERYLDK